MNVRRTGGGVSGLFRFRTAFFAVSALGAGLSLAVAPAACSDSERDAPAASSSAETGAPVADAGSGASAFCESANLPAKPFATAPQGRHRGETAGDFSLTQVDGSTFDFASSFSGCESYVFVPDALVVSASKRVSIWTKDLDTLVAASPRNVHYFFVSTSEAAAEQNTQDMQGRVDAFLGGLSEDDAAHWRQRLHVVAGSAKGYGNWVGDVLQGIGSGGFAIDRQQRIRGLGMLADVHRSSPKDDWPFQSNLAYAANEAIYMNSQAEIRARLDEEQARVTEVKLWDGEILQAFAEKEISLPSAEQMASFDTLEIEVTQTCPDPEKIEFGNCGAWDYLAWLFVYPEGGTPNDDGGVGDNGRDPRFTEMGRFITSYHRETHWIVDATPMLAELKNGGTRHFRWEYAPPWNTQPTGTKLSLRFSNRDKGYKPSELVPLYNFIQGRKFNSAYNDALDPKDVAIPSDAKKVELWAIVTGHGNDKNSCAEFCNHQHEFVVNGQKHLLEFPDTGGTSATMDKCVSHQTNGMVPNQGGTWWLGRGGWCPGQQVDPWSVDVTAAAKGQATVAYRGLFQGAPPTIAPVLPLEDGGTVDDPIGVIDMDSYLVIYR